MDFYVSHNKTSPICVDRICTESLWMFSMIVSRSFQPLAKNLWLGGYSGHQADQKNQLGMESMTLVRVAGKFEKC